MKRIALVGHRGVGKTAFLSRVSTYYGGVNVTCLDLDREVALRSGRSIADVFENDGEIEFRRIERETFLAVDRETSDSTQDVYFALGAGFDPSQIPETWQVLWIRRASDARGRVFIDRPRLNSRVPPIEEFNERFHRRQAAYGLRADETLFLDEGLEAPDAAEKDFVLGTFRSLEGTITLLPNHFRTEANFERWTKERLKWGVHSFELRDDLLSEAQMAIAVRALPDDRLLISFRLLEREVATARLIEQHGLAFDWPNERGPCAYGEPRFLSSHTRNAGEAMAQALGRFFAESEGVILKAALPTLSIAELEVGRAWQREQPQGRVFLPHSPDGRWYWDRLLKATDQPLGFLREGDGSGIDQPTLLQWARQRAFSTNENFAAVLGDPVSLSRTPIEHRDYFAELGASVFAIRVTEEEWRDGALEHLRARGLSFAAITAPLKAHAFASCPQRDAQSELLRAVNTLMWRDGWLATNTDLVGFREAANAAGALGQVAVWGGGGTLEVIKAVLPDAQLYSLRTGGHRDAQVVQNPDTVIWAVGGPRASLNVPPEEWRPRLVLDLNYSKDSPGRTYALEKKAKYLSGLTMFKAQAAAQRRFWSGTEEKL